ncbi:S24 family peptidase [Hydrogenophaga sp.]|uniref:S24 family peptidase n=1 Tax=Hydrogenophaga sp. TaxID=1904254 RepID=UPI002727152A|nr:S24 family peptidase [Hydrogenophaga sp.]MDO8905016.1 S24 family peptidase [Hydrogenophaga sp.]
MSAAQEDLPVDARSSATGALAAVGACSGSEAFALRVLGTSMEPEFLEGEIILIEPGGLVRDGSFVLAQHGGEWIFRQLCRQASGWTLHALNPAFADRPLPDLSAVRGVIIQKALPGRRNASKRYV